MSIAEELTVKDTGQGKKAVVYRMVTDEHICPFGLKISMMLKRPRRPLSKASALAALMICVSILGMRRKTRIRKPTRPCLSSLPYPHYWPVRQVGQHLATSLHSDQLNGSLHFPWVC